MQKQTYKKKRPKHGKLKPTKTISKQKLLQSTLNLINAKELLSKPELRKTIYNLIKKMI